MAAGPAGQGSRIFYGLWVVAGGFVLLFLFAGAGFYSFSIFIKPLEEAFGWSRAEISLTMSIYMFVHGLCGPLIGHLIRVYGPKRIMTAYAFMAGSCFILVSFTPALWFFYLAYAMLSFSTVGIGFIPVSDILARWFVRRRGTAIGSAMLGISVGGLVMAPLIGLIITRYGWRASFVFLGLLVWLLAMPVTLFVFKGGPEELGLLPDGEAPTPKNEARVVPEEGHALSGDGIDGWPLRAAFRTKAFIFIALTYLLAPMAQMGVLQHQVPLIMEAGISPAAAAAALGLTAGLGGLGKLTFGRLTEILPFHHAAILCFGLQALAVFVLLQAHSLAMIWVYVIIFGFAMGGVIVLLPLVVGHFFGLASFGVIMGTVSFIQAVGSSSGALISGLIYDWTNSYRIALIIYIGVYLTAALSIFLAGTPRPYNRPETPVRFEKC